VLSEKLLVTVDPSQLESFTVIVGAPHELASQVQSPKHALATSS